MVRSYALLSPGPLLDDLAALVIQLDDTELVGGDIAIHLVEIGYCNVRCADAIDFASALRLRLQRYVHLPEVAEAARQDFRACESQTLNR